MLVYLVNYAKRMLYSEQPNVLLEKAKHNFFKQFWKFQFHFFQFLRLFTCVSWGIPPAQILLIVQSAAIRHSDFPFSSFSIFLYSEIYKKLFLSAPSVLSCVLYCSLYCPSFYSFLLFFLLTVFSLSVCSLFLSLLQYFLFSCPSTPFCLLLPYVLLLVSSQSVLFLLEPSI